MTFLKLDTTIQQPPEGIAKLNEACQVNILIRNGPCQLEGLIRALWGLIRTFVGDSGAGPFEQGVCYGNTLLMEVFVPDLSRFARS